MRVVTVTTAPNGFGSNPVTEDNAPAARTTIMVSPMARDAAKTMAPTMPGRAAGKITLVTVSAGVAPRPSEPSRIACGTALVTSSDKDETNGTNIIPITTPAVRTETVLGIIVDPTTACKKGPTVTRAKIP